LAVHFLRDGEEKSESYYTKRSLTFWRRPYENAAQDVDFVSAYLSGGVDSSAICSLLSARVQKPFKAVSIGFPEEEFNELPYAKPWWLTPPAQLGVPYR